MKKLGVCHCEESRLSGATWQSPRDCFASLAMTASLFIAMTALLFIIVPKVYAQNMPVGMANVYEITDKKAVDGDILVYDAKKGIIRSTVAFANNIFGVLQTAPLLVFKTSEGQSGSPVARLGVANVNVTTLNGAINQGNYITTSSKPGKGQKATVSGYIVGVALADLKKGEGKIPVAMRIEYLDLSNSRSLGRLLDSLGILATQSTNDSKVASQFMKYFVAGLIVVLSFLISFFIFGRSIGKGIEAIGRNPLARRSIELSLMLNVAFTLCIVLIAAGIAYAIVRF